jgi:hypothetical protein
MLVAGIPMRSHSNRSTRAILAGLVAAAVLIAGCSSQFVYNRLDSLVYLYVKTQVSLEDLQAAELRGSLRSFLDWHRSSELPRYAEFAQSLARDAARPLGRARIDQARLEIERLWRDAMARGGPDAARFLAGLSPEQRAELFASLGEDDDELRKEYCETPAEKRLERQQRSFTRAAEKWVGPLTAAQKQLVATRLAALKATSCGWAENRIRVRLALRGLVERSSAEANYVGAVTRLLASPEERWDPAYRAAFESNRDAIIDLLAELDARLTVRQRARLSEQFTAYARDFRRLAANPAAAAAARD